MGGCTSAFRNQPSHVAAAVERLRRDWPRARSRLGSGSVDRLATQLQEMTDLVSHMAVSADSANPKRSAPARRHLHRAGAPVFSIIVNSLRKQERIVLNENGH